MAGTTRPGGRGSRTLAPLNRQRVLQTALWYVDDNGLDALSMHKLGAALGVQTMSLYYYIENKDDMLDSLVDLLWSEIDPQTIGHADWRSATRSLAHALRDVVHRHPHAALLLMSRQVTSPAGLRVHAAYLTTLHKAGFDRGRALEILRILIAYGFGYAQTELASFAPPLGGGRRNNRPQPRRRMRPVQADLPDDLLELAQEICSGTDTTEHFDLGIELMLRGLEPSAPKEAH